MKYKLEHKRTEKEERNISDKAQPKRLINLLKGIIDNLEHEGIGHVEEEQQAQVKRNKQKEKAEQESHVPEKVQVS